MDSEESYPAKPDERLVRRVSIAGGVAGALGLGISVVLVLSVLFDLPWKIAYRITSTAIALCIGTSLLLTYTGNNPSTTRRRVIQGLSFLTLLVALLTMFEYATDINLGIDFGFVGKGPLSDSSQNRMPPNSALAFFLISSSVFIQSTTTRFTRTAQVIALLAAMIAMLALIGYGYGVGHLYSFAGLAAMSLLGAISFLLLSFSALVIRSTSGILALVTSARAGGSTARRLFVPVIIVPPLLGLITLSGYYARLYDTPFGVSLLVIMAMMIFAGVTSLIAMRLENADTRRSVVEEELSTSREELRELSMHVQAVQEEERIRIAREIHDELGQSLTALKMDVSLLKGISATENGEVHSRLDSMLSLVDSTIRSVQRISTELRPGVLDDLGLTAALEWQSQEFQRRTGILCVLTVTPQEVITDEERSTALFRILQETLTNVARHAHARRVIIHLNKNHAEILLRISDDGRGISPDSLTRSESIGLIGMRERALLLGGSLEITGVPGSGTTVEVRLPLDAPR